MSGTILSLFDFTGTWSRPYREAGYNVIQVDIKLGSDVLKFMPTPGCSVHGVLAAPPCTDFSVSGARWWKDKDADGRTEASLGLVDATLSLIDEVSPHWWALENPVGRLQRLRPQLGSPFYFQPHWYGDPYTKKTGLWGSFNRNLKRRDVEPVVYESAGKKGSWMWAKLGGTSDRTKTIRSTTPPGFARAFFDANP